MYTLFVHFECQSTIFQKRTQVILHQTRQKNKSAGLSGFTASLAYLLQQPGDALRGLSADLEPVLDLFAIPLDSLDPARLGLLAFFEQTAFGSRHDWDMSRDGVVCAHRVERLAISGLAGSTCDDAVVDLLRRGDAPVRRQAQADRHGERRCSSVC